MSSLHQIEALVKAGVKDIVLAVNYRPEVMVSVLKKTEEEFGINITFSVETEPLGTGEIHQFQKRGSLFSEGCQKTSGVPLRFNQGQIPLRHIGYAGFTSPGKDKG